MTHNTMTLRGQGKPLPSMLRADAYASALAAIRPSDWQPEWMLEDEEELLIQPNYWDAMTTAILAN